MRPNVSANLAPDPPLTPPCVAWRSRYVPSEEPRAYLRQVVAQVPPGGEGYAAPAEALGVALGGQSADLVLLTNTTNSLQKLTAWPKVRAAQTGLRYAGTKKQGLHMSRSATQ